LNVKRQHPLSLWPALLACLWIGTPSAGADPALDPVSPLRRATQLVRDIDEVLPFYRDLLGFRVLYDQVGTNPPQLRLHGIPAKQARLVALESPRTDIQGGLVGLLQILEPVPDEDFSSGNRVALLLLTTDARALYARLEAAGVTMLSQIESYKAARSEGTTLAFTVVDPAGTRISFAELNAEPP
jgi:catechol 2,3-dioxygenase-like lactoylglutathione lyase family enzyme